MGSESTNLSQAARVLPALVAKASSLDSAAAIALTLEPPK